MNKLEEVKKILRETQSLTNNTDLTNVEWKNVIEYRHSRLEALIQDLESVDIRNDKR